MEPVSNCKCDHQRYVEDLRSPDGDAEPMAWKNPQVKEAYGDLDNGKAADINRFECEEDLQKQVDIVRIERPYISAQAITCFEDRSAYK